MIRAIAIIVAAIKLSQPGISQAQAESYARVLQREAKEHDFDPLTGVAIVHRESHWVSSAISADGEDYGLGQIRARYIGACRQDPDPVHAPSEACQVVKQSLLQGEYNLRVMADLITRNRQLCKEKTGSARFEQWLASYEGRNYPGLDRWCRATDDTREVISYRQWLIVNVVSPQRRRTASSGKATAKRDKGTSSKRRSDTASKKGKPAAQRAPTVRKRQPSKGRTK